MPRSKNTPRETAVGPRQLVINFEDDASLWFQNLSAAVSGRPREIEIQFVGGCVAPPYEIIALRNALLGIPRSIRLVTTALVSLPPMTCAAWLVGDERRIARDAVVWIPEIPEDILRNGLRRHQHASREGAVNKAMGVGEEEFVEEDERDDDAEDPVPFRRTRTNNGRQRCERDLRALADVINEWFPSWEFKGSCLTFDDLVVWDVVKPEWGFGGRGVRHRPEAHANTGRTRTRVKQSRSFEGSANSGKANMQVPLNRGKAEPDGQKLPQGAQDEFTPVKDASNGSGKAPEPESASKPSDL